MKTVVKTLGMMVAVGWMASWAAGQSVHAGEKVVEKKSEQQVVIVTGDELPPGVAETLKKLPDKLRAQVESQLKAALGKQEAAEHKTMRVQVRHAEHHAGADKQPEASARDKEPPAVHQVEVTADKPHVRSYVVVAEEDGDGKPEVIELKAGEVGKLKAGAAEPHKVGIAIAIADDDQDGKSEAKTITVQIDGDRVLLNGKPIGVVRKGGGAATGTVQKRIALQLQKAKEAGKTATQTQTMHGEHHTLTITASEAHPHAHAEVKKAEVTEGAAGKHELRVRAVQVDGEKHPRILHPQTMTLKVAPVESAEAAAHVPHVVVLRKESGEAKTDAAVLKQLRSIESELKKIRTLLEQMQKK